VKTNDYRTCRGLDKSVIRALARKACRDGCSALYRDLAIASADGSLRSLLTRLSRIDVLVIDRVIAPRSEAERRSCSWSSK